MVFCYTPLNWDAAVNLVNLFYLRFHFFVHACFSLETLIKHRNLVKIYIHQLIKFYIKQGHLSKFLCKANDGSVHI